MGIEKMILRDFNKQDIELLVQYLNNSNVAKFLTSRVPQPYTIENAEWWVNIGSKEGITKAVEVNGTFVGTIGAKAGELESIYSAEIGYWFAEKYWGKGMATDAVQKMTKYIFSHTDIIRLHAPVFSPNKASMRVLEKCGYQLEGILKSSVFKNSVFLDKHLYAKINL